MTTFPPDFPIPTQGKTATEASGRGYAFIRDSKLADASEYLKHVEVLQPPLRTVTHG